MLPEKWAVFAETWEQTKIISNWCNENAKGKDNTNYNKYPFGDYTHSDFVKDENQNFRRVFSNIVEGYTEISFDQFLNEVVEANNYEYRVKPEFIKAYRKFTGVINYDRFNYDSRCYHQLKDAAVLDIWTERVEKEPEYHTIISVEGKEYQYKIGKDDICIIEGGTTVFIYAYTIATIWRSLQAKKDGSEITAITNNVNWTVSVPAPEYVNIGCQKFKIDDVLEMIEKFNKKSKK